MEQPPPPEEPLKSSEPAETKPGLKKTSHEKSKSKTRIPFLSSTFQMFMLIVLCVVFSLLFGVRFREESSSLNEEYLKDETANIFSFNHKNKTSKAITLELKKSQIFLNKNLKNNKSKIYIVKGKFHKGVKLSTDNCKALKTNV